MQSINYAGNHLCHKEVGARKQKLPEEIKGGKKREEKRKKKNINKKKKGKKVTGSWEKSTGSLPHLSC